MESKESKSLKRIEQLLEKLICELILDIPVENLLPISDETFLEMEKEIGEKIYFMGLS